MKTNHLQSIKQANKQTINDLHHHIVDSTEYIKQLRRVIKDYEAMLAKKVDQQKQVKADISASKVTRPAGSRRKHNKSDPRYVAWYTSSHAERNGEGIGGAAPAAVKFDNIPVAVGCSC